MSEEQRIAVFVDYENLAHGSHGERGGGFRMDLVLRRLLEKGRVVFKRAYCDWSRYNSAVEGLHRLGIELVDIPRSKVSGKNSADIRMVVDAIDLCYGKTHIDTFALCSGDSDFTPLAAKLKENDKNVIGCGVKSSTSDLLIQSCDEFLYYDDLVRADKPVPKPRGRGKVSQKQQEARERLVETVRGLELDYDTVWGSMVKQTIRRVYPGFSEAYYGYPSFTALLEEAGEDGLVELDFDEERGNFKVRLPRAS